MGSKRKRQVQDVSITGPATKKQHQALKSQPTNPPSPPPQNIPFVSDPKGAELHREATLYEQLSSADPIERLQAADAVVSGLLGGEGVPETTLQRHLERRLFRGLASGRKGARLGFSIAVTEILRQLLGERPSAGPGGRYAGLTFLRLLGMLRAKTKAEGDVSGQEERDHALGLLFGLQCFVRAQVLFQEGDEGDERWKEMFATLVQLWEKKSWMREECGWVVVEALGQMRQPQAEKTLVRLHEAGLAASPEGVGIWITARRKFPDMQFPAKPWGHSGNPLEHLKILAKVLKESSSSQGQESEEQIKQTGNWNPQLHFAWTLVKDEYIEKAKAGNAEDFTNFWKVAVDENLFSLSASSERKFWGFLLFQRMLSEAVAYPVILDGLFSPNFMRCLINHASHDDRFLHRAAEKSLRVIQQTIKAHPSIAAATTSGLINRNGVYNFDQITKTKTIEKILLHVPTEFRESVFDALLLPVSVMKMSVTSKDAESYRQLFGDYVLTMIRQINVSDASINAAWIQSTCLPSLASLAYSLDENIQPALTEKSRIVFRNRLSSALRHLISAPDYFTLPCNLVQQVNPSAINMDEDITAVKDQALVLMEKLMKKARKSKEQRKGTLEALALLYSMAIFQLYNGEADAVSLLEELKICCDKLTQVKTKTDSEAPVVLVEILLSLMSKSSVLLRRIAQQVFTAFSNEITEESLKILLDVLDSSESLKGQQELFDQDDEEEEEDGDEDEDEDDELDSDVEVVDINGAAKAVESGDSEEEDESNDDSDDEVDEEEGDDEDARKLDEALANALGTHRADEDPNAESSDSDADMSDSEMMALDLKLVEIFSQRKKQPNKKQEKKDARENIINFKSRVLDLLEIYVKEQASNPQAFDLLVPLLKLIRTTTAKSLGERAHKILITFAKATKGLKPHDSTTPVDVSGRLQILTTIHGEASQDPSHAFAKAASTASLLLASSLYRASRSSVKEIATVYRDTQVEWLRGERRIQPSFFHEWVNWCQSHAAAVGVGNGE